MPALSLRRRRTPAALRDASCVVSGAMPKKLAADDQREDDREQHQLYRARDGSAYATSEAQGSRSASGTSKSADGSGCRARHRCFSGVRAAPSDRSLCRAWEHSFPSDMVPLASRAGRRPRRHRATLAKTHAFASRTLCIGGSMKRIAGRCYIALASALLCSALSACGSGTGGAPGGSVRPGGGSPSGGGSGGTEGSLCRRR